MRRIVMGLLLSMLLPAAAMAAPAQGCRSSRLINTSGFYLRLNSGEFFRLFPGSQQATAIWLPQDKILVCHVTATVYEITNLNRKSSVKGLRQN